MKYMNHKFKVVDKIENMTFFGVESEGGIKINDNLVQYMLDSFRWIPTHWNKIAAENNGLNYHGATFIVERSDILQMKNIIIGWKNLFELASDKFILHTEYDVEERRFVETNMEKNSVVSELDSLIVLCENALKEEKIIVHFGI